MTDFHCGQALASSAAVPEKLGALMAHVATNLLAHADWVGAETPEALAECDALRAVAGHYRAIAEAAGAAARSMRSFADLAPTVHDPARFDRDAFRRWLDVKLRLQRELAALLLEHAALASADDGT